MRAKSLGFHRPISCATSSEFSTLAILSSGPSGGGAIDDPVRLALAPAADGVVLAEGVGGVVLPEEDAAEVGVVAEADAEHVEDLALGPLGAGPEVAAG